MALANTTWDDFPADRGFARSARPRRSGSGAAIAAAILASCVFAAVPTWHAVQNFLPAAPRVAQPGRATAASAAARAALERNAQAQLRLSLQRRQFESNAEGFLHESLQLTRACTTACAAATSEIAEAERVGRFGPPGVATWPGAAPLPTGPALQQRFDSLVAGSFALLSSRPAPQIGSTARAAVPAPAPVAAPVRIAPSVVVPLPREIPAAVPVPAARLDRPADTDVAAAMASEPLADAAPPPATRVPSPAPGQVLGRNDGVAVYDISAAKVYMPDGARLEAHSGLGYMVDNPRYVDRRNTGPTPPNTYNLVMRKGRFHGVDAIRLLPADGNNKFGRVGLLAHTYLLRGRPAESNGCVVFKDYSRFLEAFRHGAVKRLVVVPSLAQSSVRIASN